MIKGKRHVILFSGGYDSTSILINLLNNPKEYDFDIENDMIELVVVQHYRTGESKLIRENNAISLILYELFYKNDDYKDFKYHVSRIQTTNDITYKKEHPQYLVQPVIWASSIIPILDDGDILYFGYILDDEHIVPNVHYIKDFINIACKLTGLQDFHVDVRFPLLYIRKSKILTELNKYNPKILEMCSNCNSYEDIENFQYHCGKCESCKHVKHSLMEIIVDNIDKEDVNFAKKKMLDWFNIDVGNLN